MNEDAIFLAALDRPPAERASFLAEACGADDALHRRVDDLLRASEQVGDFMARPAVDPPDTATADGPVSAGDTLACLSSSERPDSLGRIGRYEVLEVLGRGGFGIVFRALDEVLQRVVAVKVLSPHLAATSPARKRFLREARAAAAIRHDNVVQIYAVEEEPLPHLVMEFIPGETLQQRLDRTGPLAVAEVLWIGREIAAGLAAALAIGLIHRDVKPSNVLIERGVRERVKLTDFGLARAADDARITHSGVLAGTPMYMAPEQARGERVDHRSDLFSLGSTLYTMVAGRPPFRAPTTYAVLKRVAEESPRPIPESIPETPLWLCDLIAKLQAKTPEARYQTAAEVAGVLERCLATLQQPGGVPDIAAGADSAKVEPSTGPGTPAGRGFGRSRWAVAAATLILLLAGLGTTEATGVTKVRSTVVRLFTSEGTLVVETEDPEVKVSIDGEELVIAGAGVKELRVKPGQYKVQGSKDGKVVRQQLVTVTRNGVEVVKIGREPPPVANKEPGPAPLDRHRRAALGVRALSPCGLEILDERGRPVGVEHDAPLPETPFRLATVGFGAEAFNDFGDAFAEKVAAAMPDVRLLGAHMPGRQTTAGLAQVVKQPLFVDLKFLNLGSPNLDDGIFVHLAKLPDLDNLRLHDCPKVTGKGIAALSACRRLGSLTFVDVPVSAQSIAEMGRLPMLTYLNLGATRLTADHVTALARLKLVHLHVAGTGLDDALLAKLHGMTTLKKLAIQGNPVTPAGVAALQRALPDCKIEWK